MHNVYNFWQLQILQNDDFISVPTQPQHGELDAMQNAVVHTFKRFL